MLVLRQWRVAFVSWWQALTRTQRVAFAIKLLALATFVLATNEGLAPTKRSILGNVALVVAWAFAITSLTHIAFFTGKISRAIWSVLLVASTITASCYRAVFNEPLSMLDLEQLLSLIGFVDMVLSFYGRLLLAPILYSLLGLVAINLGPFATTSTTRKTNPRLARFRAPGIQLSPILLMLGILFSRNGKGTNGFATQYTTLAFLSALGIERVAEGRQPARNADVKIVPTVSAETKDRALRTIIVVMDESIRGDLLDLNKDNGAITGLKGRPDVINFGVMSSIANCSLESNVSVRYGIGRANYLHQLKVNPSIFDYANKAGYATYYFDAQRTSGLLQNGMDERERNVLTGGLVQVPRDLKVHDRDIELAKVLRRTLDEKKDTPNFIYVNKMGAHYPYEGKYPDDQRKWTPSMRSDFFGNESEPGCGCHCGQGCRTMGEYEGADLDSDFRLRFKNSYLNAVSWNTGRFFDILLEGADLSKTLIVYMADHGQDFHEDGRPGLNTHCTPHGEAHPSEGRVPLAILTGNEAIASQLRNAATTNLNRLSQFNVFPSVLHWMGYAEDDIKKLDVDPPIEQPVTSEDTQKFLSVFYVRLGAKPVWTSINRPAHHAH